MKKLSKILALVMALMLVYPIYFVKLSILGGKERK